MLSKLANLAIVDEHTMFRKTLKNYLSEQKEMRVVIESSDIPDLFKKLKEFPVDILIVDVSMATLDLSDVLKTIYREYPNIKTIVLSMSTDIELIGDLLDSGIHGYISKTDEPEELIKCIVATAENRIYRNRLFTEALYRNKQNNIKSYTDNRMVILNDREKQMLQMIWEENSNKEIADKLFLGVRSVEKIRQDMKEKIRVRSTVGLLKYAIHKKIISVGVRSSDLIK